MDYDPLDLVFDSSNSTLRYDNSYPYKLLLTPTIPQCYGFQLLWLNIPMTYYVVNSLSDEFYLRVNNITYLAKLPEGTYNSVNFCTMLSAVLAEDGLVNMQYEISDYDGKLKIYSVLGYNVSIPANQSSPRLMEMIGGDSRVQYDSSNQLLLVGGSLLQKNVLVMPQAVNLLGNNTIKVVCSLTGDNPLSNCTDGRNVDRLMTIIPVNAPFGGMIKYKHKRERVPLTGQSLSTFSVQLLLGDEREFPYLDASGALQSSRYLNLNGAQFQMGVRLFLK
jgi:hypothetical protein